MVALHNRLDYTSEWERGRVGGGSGRQTVTTYTDCGPAWLQYTLSYAKLFPQVFSVLIVQKKKSARLLAKALKQMLPRLAC